MSTRVLTSTDVERLVDPQVLLEALAAIHRSLARGAAVQPVPVPLRAADDTAPDAPAVVPMMSLAPALGLFAVKVLADAPRNRDVGRPAQRSTITLYSAESGECLGVVDGRALTRVRTAGATTLASRALARPDSRRLTLLGAGALAVEHGRAMARVFDFDDIRVWSRSAESSERAVAALRDAGLPAAAAHAVTDAVRGADIVCTLTPATRPLLTADMLAPGTHVNAVGSPPRREYSEVAPDVFARAARVAVDSRAVCLSDSGNICNAVAEGAVAAGSLVEIGEILEGTAPGRLSADELTIFNSVGIGLQDLVAAHHVLMRAERAGTGTMVVIRD